MLELSAAVPRLSFHPGHVSFPPAEIQSQKPSLPAPSCIAAAEPPPGFHLSPRDSCCMLRETLARSWRAASPVRVWWVGCESGGWAYGAAIMLADEYGHDGWEVLVSDEEQEALAHARSGRFPLVRPLGWPTLPCGKHYSLVRSVDGPVIRVKKHIRDRIRFIQARLGSLLPPFRPFDAIAVGSGGGHVCADDPDTVVALAHRLRRGGHLILPKAVPLSDAGRAILAPTAPAIYRRL